MSALLFSLNLNDLYEFLEAGLDVEGTNVRLLMYADDIVILSEHPNVLQKRIHNFYKNMESGGKYVQIKNYGI